MAVARRQAALTTTALDMRARDWRALFKDKYFFVGADLARLVSGAKTRRKLQT